MKLGPDKAVCVLGSGEAGKPRWNGCKPPEQGDRRGWPRHTGTSEWAAQLPERLIAVWGTGSWPIGLIGRGESGCHWINRRW